MTDTRSMSVIANASDGIDVANRLVPRLAARAVEHDRTGTFPADDFEDLSAGGLLGLMVPSRLGGPGGDFADYVQVAMKLAQGNGATALIYNMHASVTGALAHTSEGLARSLGAPEQSFAARDRLLVEALEGSLFAVAMSERGAGARLSQMTTTYEQVDGRYHVRGSKAFVSGAGHADRYLVAARSTENEHHEVSHFLIPAGKGITVRETWDALGMRATGSHDIDIDVYAGEEALLGGIEGLSLPLAFIMPQWLVASYAAVYVGVAQSAIDAAVAHVKTRGHDSLSSVRSRLGRADAAVAAARLAVEEAARRIDAAPGERETNRWVYRAKLLAGETAMTVAASMLEAAGASATRRGNPLERIYRDARCGSLQPATSDVCADWLGIAASGGSPDSDAQAPRW